MRLVVSQTFFLEMAGLQRPVRERVGDLMRKFRADSSLRGLNLEKPTRSADPRSRTVRVDQQYRAVVVAPEEGDAYLLMGVFNHDDAYDWCARNRIGVNATTGAIEVEDVTALAAAQANGRAPEEPASAYFTGRPDKDFTKLGIEERFLLLIRRVRDEGEATTLAEILPTTQGAALSMLAAGYSVEDAWAELAAVPVREASPATDLGTAIENPVSQSMYYVLGDDEELLRLLDKPLALWRIFLHPSQRRVALRPSYSGPARVSGGAGTGKTVVLLHRAYMLANASPATRLLVTTFTKNLASDLASLLVDLGGNSIRGRVEALNIDAVAQRVLRDRGVAGSPLCFDDDERRVFEEAVRRTETALAADVVRQEWRQVVLAQGITDADAYLATPRPGRGVRLGRLERIAVWRTIEAALDLLGPRRTFLQLADEAARTLISTGHHVYEHVLVDEAQDLHPAQWRLIRALVPRTPNDLFIAGDTHQRIYGNRVTLGSLGIDVRGRSTRLTLNYRSTQEILRWSTGLLRGQAFDDLDGETASLHLYRSRLRGPQPRTYPCSTATEELSRMVATVNGWVRDGVEPSAIAVTARTRTLCRKVISALEGAGVPVVDLGVGEVSYHASAVSVGTMHRLKGLEFRCVAVVGCSENEVPPRGAVTPEAVDPVEHRRDLLRERSLLYVACTRARDDLAVSWAGKPSGLLPAEVRL
jgi:hypothetical protein